MQNSQVNSKRDNSVLKLCDSQPHYAKCVNKDEYQACKDSTSWFYNLSENSERGDTHNKSIESNSFYNDCASSRSVGCVVTTKEVECLKGWKDDGSTADSESSEGIEWIEEVKKVIVIEDDSEQSEMSEEEALVIWHKLKMQYTGYS